MKNQLNLLAKDSVHSHFKHVRKTMPEEFSKKHFSKAQEWESTVNVVENIRLILPWLKSDERLRILDVGVGTGKLPVTLQKMGNDFYALDDDAGGRNSAEFLKQIFPSLKVDVCSLESSIFPFENRYFDMVTSLDVIEHLPGSPRHYLYEIYRVLRPGGVFLLSNPNPTSLYNSLRMFVGKSNYHPLSEWFQTACNDEFGGHWREYTLQELVDMITFVGFGILNKGRLAKAIRRYEGTDASVINRTSYLVYKLFTSYVIPWMANDVYVLCSKPTKKS